jgi:DNA-binding NtrC family response regulator
VRELENAIQRAVALCSDSVITPEELVLATGSDDGADVAPSSAAKVVPAGVTTMRDMERELIRKTLEDTGGNRTRAAKVLGISLRTLRNKLNEFGLQDRPAKFAQSRAHA